MQLVLLCKCSEIIKRDFYKKINFGIFEDKFINFNDHWTFLNRRLISISYDIKTIK